MLPMKSKIKEVYKALKQEYGDSYPWKEVKEVLEREAKSLNISKRT